MTLRIGHLSTLYHTSMVMMAMDDLLEGFPAAIEWKLFGTGPAIVEAFSKGMIDIGYIGLPPAIIGIERGVRILCVAGGHIEGTVIASHKNASGFPETDNLVEILSQFRSIGVPGKGSIHDLILRDAIDSAGADVRVVNFKWSDNLLESFIKNEIDAVIGTPALAQSIITFASGKIIIPPDLLWPNNPSYGILVREDALIDHKETINKFIQCHKVASELLRTEREEVSRDIASYIAVVDNKFVLDTLNISPHYCIALTEDYVECSMRLAVRLRDLGYVDRDVERSDIFDMSFVNEVHPEIDHYRS